MDKNDVEDVVDVAEIVPVVDEDGNDTTDWKALAEERHALAVKNQGIAKRYKTKLEKAKESPANPGVQKEQPKPSEMGYAEKAYLVASGVKGADETKLVADFMENTGKSLEEVVENKFFQAELKDLRESKASADAVPKGSKRSGVSTKDSVDYWMAKGELPENTPENQELRRKVVNARYERESAGSKFAGNSTGNVVRQSQLRK